METMHDDSYGDLLTTKDVGALLGIERTKVKQLDRDNCLIVLKRGKTAYVPARLLEPIPPEDLPTEEAEDEEPSTATHRPLWNLRGTITLLRDAGYSSEDILDWLWAEDAELEQPPIAALEMSRHHHVNRIAGVLSF